MLTAFSSMSHQRVIDGTAFNQLRINYGDVTAPPSPAHLAVSQETKETANENISLKMSQ